MKKFYTWPFYVCMMAATSLFFVTGCGSKDELVDEDKYDGPDEAAMFEIERTKDPATGKVPWNSLLQAKLNTETARETARQSNRIQALSWIERGSNGDFNGPQGNSRPNQDQTAGRIRAAMVDSRILHIKPFG